MSTIQKSVLLPFDKYQRLIGQNRPKEQRTPVYTESDTRQRQKIRPPGIPVVAGKGRKRKIKTTALKPWIDV